MIRGNQRLKTKVAVILLAKEGRICHTHIASRVRTITYDLAHFTVRMLTIQPLD